MRTFRYAIIDSTNDEAKRLLAAGAIGREACVLADAQTSGRGTHGRLWYSPPGGGVYLTVARRVRRTTPLSPQFITPALGAACLAVLQRELSALQSDTRIELRGVNDLYAAGRKLGGLLTEVLAHGERITSILVGVGVNVRAGSVKLPAADPVRAISLDELTADGVGADWDIELLADALARAVSGALDRIVAAAPATPCPARGQPLQGSSDNQCPP